MPTTNPDERIAANVRAEMARRSISQQTIARQLGWTQAYASRRIRGRTPFDAGQLEQVAEIIGVPISELYGKAVA